MITLEWTVLPGEKKSSSYPPGAMKFMQQPLLLNGAQGLA
jgi:hypothetical protein